MSLQLANEERQAFVYIYITAENWSRATEMTIQKSCHHLLSAIETTRTHHTKCRKVVSIVWDRGGKEKSGNGL